MSAIGSGFGAFISGSIMYGAASYTKLVNPGQAFVVGFVGSLLNRVEVLDAKNKRNVNVANVFFAILGSTYLILNALDKSVTLRNTLGLGVFNYATALVVTMALEILKDNKIV